MVYMFNATWPPATTPEVAKVMQDIGAKLSVPEFLTQRGPYWYTTSEGTQGVFSLFELDRSKMPEAYDYLVTLMRMLSVVPGLTREIKYCSEFEDLQRTTPPA